jgi:hypothetical protein
VPIQEIHSYLRVCLGQFLWCWSSGYHPLIYVAKFVGNCDDFWGYL